MIQAATPSAESTTTRVMTGGNALAEMFALAGPTKMFGMGGFQLLPYYEGVRRLGLDHHLTDDERSATFALDAYARVTGRPGICDATLGPGATNLVTGLVESLNAGIPMIVLIGDAHRDHATKNMTQEARQLDILRPAAKEVIRVESGLRIPEHVRRAFMVATSGRPGPVVIAIPEDVSHSEFDYPPTEFWLSPQSTSAPSLRSRPDQTAMARAADMVAASRRPLILAGGGIHLSGAYEPLRWLAEENGIPVAHTLSGKGSIACSHPLSAGIFGRYSRYANELIQSSDCLLVVGCKLGEIATKRYALPDKGTPMIHLDIEPGELGRWYGADVMLLGDASLGMEDLQTALVGRKVDRSEYVSEVVQRRDDWDRETHAKYSSDEVPITMGRLVGELNDILPDDAIVVADGGFAAHWAGLLFNTSRTGRGFVANRGFASIGYGLPGALGAQLAAPDRPVVGVTGDGGLNMSIGGLETALRTRAGFTLVVVNNAASGYVKALQHSMYGESSYQSSDLTEVNFAEVARAYGCHGVRVEDPAKLGHALAESIKDLHIPTVIDVVVTRDPSRMLPGVDSRTVKLEAGDRIA